MGGAACSRARLWPVPLASSLCEVGIIAENRLHGHTDEIGDEKEDILWLGWRGCRHGGWRQLSDADRIDWSLDGSLHCPY